MKKNENKGETGITGKIERKIVEKNRRIHMKILCFKLYSLIPKEYHSSSNKHVKSLPDRIDHAASYIKQAGERIEALKRRKLEIISTQATTDSRKISDSSISPILELRNLGSNLEVILISGLNKNFMFYQVIKVLEEEGVEVVNASLATMSDRIIHTIHSQESSSRVGIEFSRVRERLKELIYN